MKSLFAGIAGAALLAGTGMPAEAQPYESPIPATAQTRFPAPAPEVFSRVFSQAQMMVLMTTSGGRFEVDNDYDPFIQRNDPRHPAHPRNAAALAPIMNDVDARLGSSISRDVFQEILGRANTATRSLGQNYGQLSIYVRPANSNQTQSFHYIVRDRGGTLHVRPYEQAKPIAPGIPIVADMQLVHELTERLGNDYAKDAKVPVAQIPALKAQIRTQLENGAPNWIKNRVYGPTTVNQEFPGKDFRCVFSVQANVSPQQDREQRPFASISGNVQIARCDPAPR